MTTRGVTLAALLAALSRPSWWLLALAGFLVRGGVLLFVVAIVMLPSPLVLSNVLEPVIAPIALGGASLVTLAPLLIAIAGLLACLLAGSWIGAATEVALIRAWQGVFPTLFRPLSELPSDLVPHLRVPEELFDVQTRMYGRYHVTDPGTFYTQNDLWTVTAPTSSKQSLPNEAYYVMMRMPGATKAEFLLLQPMIPKDRPNMIAWVAAQNDPGVRGKTTVFRFPSEGSIFGPAQVEAQIDADPVISAQVTLWDQSGSSVIRGNLIVVPVGNSLIYLQPVYLQSQSAKFPSFERIVVASPRNIVWGSTLQEALNLLLAKETGSPGPTPTPSPTPSPGPSATPGPTGSPGVQPTPPAGDIAALVAYANQHFELAQEALRNNDFARYGQELALVKQALAQLQALVGPPPSAAP